MATQTTIPPHPSGLFLSPRAAELFPDTDQSSLMRASLQHPAVFLDVFGIIHDPTRGQIPFRLWDWQWELLAILLQHKRVVVLKARQLGVSWLLAGYALWVALAKPNSTILLVSRKEGVAAELLAKSSFLYHHLPPPLRVPFSRKDRDNDTELSFANINSKLVALASTKGAGRSESATLVVPDELAFHPDDVEMYASYEPTLGTTGQIVGCSTANGRRGLFYALYTAARRGGGEFYPVFLPWQLRPDYTEAFRESKRLTFEAAGQPWLLAQEYPATEDEAFGGSLRTFFSRDALEKLSSVVAPPKETLFYDGQGEISTQAGTGGGGSLRIWQAPRNGMRYVIGADPADSSTSGSRSTALVLDARTLHHVATLAGFWEPYTFTKLLVELGRRYHQAVIAPERNNHGISVVEGLSHLWQYPNIYRTRTKVGHELRLGWITNTESRHTMLDAMRAAVADGSFFTQDGELVEEMWSFEETEAGRAQAASGARDDLIFGAAIALMARAQYPVTRRSYTTPLLSR